MADESAEQRNPSPGGSGQSPRNGESDEPGRVSNRRRIIIASLLAPPAVMTLGARSSRAQTVGSCQASLNANPGTSHHCVIPTPTTTPR